MPMPADGGQKTLNLVLKADGQGSVEALRSRVESLSNAEVDIRVILAGVGGITPNDVNLASASNAVLIGFNIRPDETVKRLAETEQVDLRFYQVIYDVENDLKKAMVGMLAPKFREVILGRAEVREIFKVSKVGTIAGCYVQSASSRATRRFACCGTRAVVFDGETRIAAALQGRRHARSRKTSSAAFRSRGSRTSKSAMSSRPGLGAGRSGVAAGVVSMVAGVRGGHVVPSGTPAISRPWEIATRTQFALAILASRIAVTPRRDNIPPPTQAR